jgi:hypothetical protein
MMGYGGEAMLFDTTSGFEQLDAVRSLLWPLEEGDRTQSATALSAFPLARPN